METLITYSQRRQCVLVFSLASLQHQQSHLDQLAEQFKATGLNVERGYYALRLTN